MNPAGVLAGHPCNVDSEGIGGRRWTLRVSERSSRVASRPPDALFWVTNTAWSLERMARPEGFERASFWFVATAPCRYRQSTWRIGPARGLFAGYFLNGPCDSRSSGLRLCLVGPRISLKSAQNKPNTIASQIIADQIMGSGI